MLHPALGEEAAAARLGAEREEFRIRAVHGDAEREREVSLELRRVVRDEVSAIRIGNQLANASQDSRSLEQLLGQRLQRAVERRDEVEALARVRRDHARQQVEVVVDDAGADGLRGHVDEPGARLAQQEQQEQEALLVCLEGRGGGRGLVH